MAPIDPHSYTNSTHPFTTHISLSLFFDFPSSIIHSSALLYLSSPFSGDLSLNTRALSITSIVDPETKSPIPFSLSSEIDSIKGALLTVSLSQQSQFLVSLETSPNSSALQWLTPPQTFNKTLPFVDTQCQAIHAWSVFPCQDTPAVRMKYSAEINIPRVLSTVMSLALKLLK